MKRINIFLVLFFIVLYTRIFSQTTHTVEIRNFSFTPAQLTIKVGDSVKWMNITGLHTVDADDNSFSSGAASSSNWVYEFLFTTVGTFPYYCGVHGGPGGVGMSGVINVEAATDVTGEGNSIDQFKLYQNYPNPFNPNTNITYQLPVSTNVTLRIYDALGNEVETLVSEEKPAGIYEVSFNASTSAVKLSSGIYFYRIQAGSFLATKQMILLK